MGKNGPNFLIAMPAFFLCGMGGVIFNYWLSGKCEAFGKLVIIIPFFLTMNGLIASTFLQESYYIYRYSLQEKNVTLEEMEKYPDNDIFYLEDVVIQSQFIGEYRRKSGTLSYYVAPLTSSTWQKNIPIKVWVSCDNKECFQTGKIAYVLERGKKEETSYYREIQDAETKHNIQAAQEIIVVRLLESIQQKIESGKNLLLLFLGIGNGLWILTGGIALLIWFMKKLFTPIQRL